MAIEIVWFIYFTKKILFFSGIVFVSVKEIMGSDYWKLILRPITMSVMRDFFPSYSRKYANHDKMFYHDIFLW